MTSRIYILHGGIFSWDGIITSAGMNTLASMLRQLPDVTVETFLWQSYETVYRKIIANNTSDAVTHDILIGYSGGGAHATWIANGYTESWGSGVRGTKPIIDLMVLYDPSPESGMMDLTDTMVARCICYYNTMPLMFGLGGGKATGPMVEIVPISMQHLAVQYSTDLHNRTVKYVRDTITGKT